MASILNAVKIIEQFEKNSLTKRIAAIEYALQSANPETFKSIYPTLEIDPDLLGAAIALKQAAGQVNVLIHAIGILLSLPQILQGGETIEALSLGAGNTGRPFDLETNLRIAEFKFINWQGGAEVVRQNSLFKDFYLLAEYETSKQRYLYVIDIQHPMKFLNGGRSIKSVMSRNINLWTGFQNIYGDRFMKVNEYYEFRKSKVQVIDLSDMIPQLLNQTTFDNTDLSPS